ncbi:MAG: GTPase Era [Acidobacteria bacterium]|nr:GTPase Era [Acidobacteriota bacterium]MCH8129222.1 GTPase Era [Acidobacteriota bacterium]MCH8990523.1 GTPase Era [Acidobacteriota bacterium]
MSASGFVPVVGRPNVGKSTLVNSLVGEKVAITSARPQTTRNTIRGVLTTDEAQLVFVDTPGFHKPRTTLGARLNTLVDGSIAEADAVLFVLDATQRIGPGDRRIAERLLQSGAPVVVAVNKVDAASHEQTIVQLGEAGEWDFDAYVPISALKDDGLDRVVRELVTLLPDGPFFFPPEMHTDQPDQFLAAELVREKYLSRLREELPHSVAVVVGDIETRDDGVVVVPATVYVERESQKGIVIGKGGELAKAVGSEARPELERLFGAKVFLDLRVKVEKDWQRLDHALDRLGF